MGVDPGSPPTEWIFRVTDADERRIISVKATPSWASAIDEDWEMADREDPNRENSVDGTETT